MGIGLSLVIPREDVLPYKACRGDFLIYLSANGIPFSDTDSVLPPLAQGAPEEDLDDILLPVPRVPIVTAGSPLFVLERILSGVGSQSCLGIVSLGFVSLDFSCIF